MIPRTHSDHASPRLPDFLQRQLAHRRLKLQAVRDARRSLEKLTTLLERAAAPLTPAERAILKSALSAQDQSFPEL